MIQKIKLFQFVKSNNLENSKNNEFSTKKKKRITEYLFCTVQKTFLLESPCTAGVYSSTMT